MRPFCSVIPVTYCFHFPGTPLHHRLFCSSPGLCTLVILSTHCPEGRNIIIFHDIKLQRDAATVCLFVLCARPPTDTLRFLIRASTSSRRCWQMMANQFTPTKQRTAYISYDSKPVTRLFQARLHTTDKRSLSNITPFFFVFYFLDDANKERKDFRHLRWCHFSHFSPTVHAVSVCQCCIKEEKTNLSLTILFLCNISRHQDQCKPILPPP